MHGRILWQFRDYVETTQGRNSWEIVLKAAGLQDRVYLPQPYPDTEVFALLQAAAKVSGRSASVVLHPRPARHVLLRDQARMSHPGRN